MFLIAEGTADVLLHSGDGEPVRLSTLKAGDFFGELALVDNEPRSADVVVKTECTAMKINIGLLLMFSAESPTAAFKLTMALLEVVGRRLRTANRKYLETLALVSVLSEGASIMTPETDAVVV